MCNELSTLMPEDVKSGGGLHLTVILIDTKCEHTASRTAILRFHMHHCANVLHTTIHSILTAIEAHWNVSRWKISTGNYLSVLYETSKLGRYTVTNHSRCMCLCVCFYLSRQKKTEREGKNVAHHFKWWRHQSQWWGDAFTAHRLQVHWLPDSRNISRDLFFLLLFLVSSNSSACFFRRIAKWWWIASG